MIGCGRTGISSRGACLLIGLSGKPLSVRLGLRLVSLYVSSVVRLSLQFFLTNSFCVCFVVNTGAPQSVVGLTCVTRTEKVLSYDVKDRSWRSILSEENLRPSHLWKFSIINEPGTPYPAFKNLVEFVRVRHCVERLYGTRFLTPILYVERRFAVDIMAGEIAAPAADDAMKRLREKRKGKKKSESSDQAASTPPPPPSSRTKTSQDVSSAGRKRRREDSASGVDASVDLVFPQDASAYSNVGSILPQVERLLLPEDKSRLREMGLSQAADWGLGHLFQVWSCDIFICIFCLNCFIICFDLYFYFV
ncbi:hypothetical protein ACOSQ4_031230 [Xanthoceras sorbifolium]